MGEIAGIVAALRSEGGCPWDRAQDERSMRPYLLEEAYEVADAIDRGDDDALRRELGDLLFQVVMLSRMAEERGVFTLRDVVEAISAKMVERHPHVFDPSHVRSEEDGEVEAWEARKAKARDGGSALDGVPLALPALLRAHRVTEKASRVGFDWPDRSGVRAKLDEEIAELDAALASGERDAIGAELGDVLFTLVNLGRFLPVGSEEALRGATARFERRFRAVESALAAEGRSVHDTALDELEARWQAAKKAP
jgi:ATP diphosphatase